MGPTRVRTKKVQKGTASGGTPPRLLEAQKNTWGGYISRGQVKYFSEISCLTPPKYSRVKGEGDIYIYIYILFTPHGFSINTVSMLNTPHDDTVLSRMPIGMTSISIYYIILRVVD